MSAYNTSGMYGTGNFSSDSWGSPDSLQGGYFNDGGNNGANGFGNFRSQLGGNARFGGWLNSQYNRTYGDYQGTGDPNLTWGNYLQQHQGDIVNRYTNENFSPVSQGVQGQRQLRWGS